ncbi:MAG TPA: hypothetical protein DEB74_11115 [Lachnospiraceae bacterium]|nr:hypothetical protein [Lachnospiraceae bacterium]
MSHVYVLDDTFKIPDEIMSMSAEETRKQIKVLEEQARKEREEIANSRGLLKDREKRLAI